MLVAASCATSAPLPASTFTFAALIALATLVTVVSLSPSLPLATVSPVALVVKPPVTALTLPVAASTLIVVPSVFTDTPSVSTARPPLSFALTDTPSAPTVRPPSVFALTDTPLASTVIPLSVFALTETLLSVETEIPSPAVTGVLPPAAPPPCGCPALIVTTCLPVAESVVVVTVTPPSPLNSTSSPLFTIEAVLPLPFAETFQPNSFNVVDKFPALTSFLPSSPVGAVTLPFATVSSTVSATTLSSSTFNPSPAFTLNLAERPS